MNISELNACTSILEQDMCLLSTYFPNSWSMENLVSLYDSRSSLLYFLKAKTAWLIHSRCRGWNEDDLTAEFITTDIPADNFLGRILSDAEDILANAYIGGMTAAEHVGEEGPMVDNAQFLLDCISSRYQENISCLFEMHKQSFLFGYYNIWAVISENSSLCELIEQKQELEYYYNAQDKEELISLFNKKQLRKLFDTFEQLAPFCNCSFDVFLRLLKETNFLEITDGYRDVPEPFCIYVLSGYEPVMAYCQNKENILTDEEAALYNCICTFENKGWDMAYSVYWNKDTSILSDGSKACFQTWASNSEPYTGENVYFGLYINSFLMLSKLLKVHHKL